ncbi:hypothetical protein GCM10009678_23130 [Actinomadura kijaniata]|uniref:hypothetical protein n=1 Tax=Actinomadura kijaniata TaxID=46161 RepID=UPI002FEB0CF8
MSVVRGEARRRWLVVAALAAALVAVPVTVAAWPVGASAPAPDRLRALVRAASAAPHEGLVETRGTLGLPTLPGLEDATGLLGGTNRIRVWFEEPRRWRVALLQPAGERGFQQTPGELTIWDYERELLTKVRGDPAVRLPNATDLTPPALARRLLALAGSGDRVTALPARRVAVRAAARPGVAPADPGTTIGTLEVWADPRTGFPLETRITPRETGRPALTSRFLDLELRRPDRGAVSPTPRPNLRTISVAAPDLLTRIAYRSDRRLPDTLAGRPALDSTPSVASLRAYRDGFASFLVAPLPGMYGGRVYQAALQAGAPEIRIQRGTVALLLRSSLLNAMLVRNWGGEPTFLIIGAVGRDRLTAVARELYP